MKVRHAEIDALEKAQAFGNKSKQGLSVLPRGKRVPVVKQVKQGMVIEST